jgi:melibiose permease/lactose/raffinose/galactose permease
VKDNVLDFERKLFNRNKWAYSVGGIGRDMVYQLVATFFITYVQFSGLGLSATQFTVIGIMLVVGRIWDAVNDPVMGSIVENTHTKWGKFRPWILIGALLTAIVIIFMFNFRPTGWAFVIFFFVMYIFWEMFFTLNDIPYWSLIPALSKNKKDRDTVTTMVVVFAGVGAFAGNAIITLTTVGRMVKGYSIISFTFAIFFVACTLLTVFGVKEPKEVLPEKPVKISIKKMFSVIAKNDQLLWASLALMLYSIGSGLLTALGYNFFWLEIGYDGTLTMIFILSFAISNILIQSFYSALAKRFTRKQMMNFSFIALVFGYAMMLSIGWVDFLPVNIVTACAFGLFVFGGQAIFYMVVIVNMTNTIEYNEFKTGDRNEAIVFSLRPFVAKMSSAIQGLIVTLVLVVSGVYGMSQNVSALEQEVSLFNEMSVIEKNTYVSNIQNGISALSFEAFEILSETEQASYVMNLKNSISTFEFSTLDDKELVVLYEALQKPENAVFSQGDNGWEMMINEAADSVFLENATISMRLFLRLAITVIPALLIFGALYILQKKYIIDEVYYEEITKITNNRIEQKLQS